MHRFFVGLVAVFGLLLLSNAEAGAQSRFGYINSQRILAEAPGTQEARTTLDSEMQPYADELGQLEAELTTLQENYQRQQGTATAAQRQAQEEELQEKILAYQQRRQQFEGIYQQRQAELVQPVMERIMEVIDEIRVEGDYVMIFDAAAGSLITADPELDLTQQVLERLGG